MDYQEPDSSQPDPENFTPSHPLAGETPTPYEECHACGEMTPKRRIHYGGITCYSCRSFFRR